MGPIFEGLPLVTHRFRMTVGPWDNAQFAQDQFVHIGLFNYVHMQPFVRWGSFRATDDVIVVPAYDGVGEDPQPRTNWNYDNCVVLTLNGRVWVGQSLEFTTYYYADFRFHNTPNGVAQALIFVRDVLDSALTHRDA